MAAGCGGILTAGLRANESPCLAEAARGFFAVVFLAAVFLVAAVFRVVAFLAAVFLVVFFGLAIFFSPLAF
jgi:hypothetical protein